MPQDSTNMFILPGRDTMYRPLDSTTRAFIDSIHKGAQVRISEQERITHQLGNWIFAILLVVLLVGLVLPRIVRRLRLLFIPGKPWLFMTTGSPITMPF
ncbi:hypothetical protein [Paraflavitalea speifideaquila]|uniref:hypothetical protein n=1 Tax=Paraflavitalea speifideaquila TaxID=3076558 RepID=UPI0028E938F0|nr:hypothetical protein [Paraflavitalea speifideiaquila]